MKDILKLIRVKHWVKNFIIFIPLVCSKMISQHNVTMSMVGFLSFSFSCSFIYIINDIRDIKSDQKHPRKKNRPLPSGRISIKKAIIISIILIIISLILNYYATNSLLNRSLFILIAYLTVNVLYSNGFKDIVILDIMLLSLGFVLRVYYGASLINVKVSNWLYLTILSFSLFMGIGKRKKEYKNNKNVRKVLNKYNDTFLNNYQNVFIALTFAFYSLWTIEQSNKYIVFTIPIIIFIFMRYSLILETGDEGDPTTIIYQDNTMLASLIVFAIIFILLLIFT